uniref:Transcriptional factor Rph1 n=1 Tax=Metschnikowia australis TaxID=27321 RepID=A0A513ZSA7_9ASCO|nr:transcriptional factor Rph1 [Metschnikowia australis]
MQNNYQEDPDLIVEPSYYSGGVPVFEPTMAQFRDFYRYNKAINKYGMQSGIVKVVPPSEWLAQLQGTYTHESLSRISIKNPIVQNMNASAGYKGVYSSQNVERQRKYSIFQWKALAQKPSNMPPAHKNKRRGSGSVTTANEEEMDPDLRMNTRRRCKENGTRKIDEILCGDFNIDASEFSEERCNELELLYWKSLGYAEPMYGADMLGSLFRENTEMWNVAKLPNLLDLMEEKIPGVNDAYLYAGLWKATFSWHLEDQDLYSINYLHFGAPKQWYSIPQSQNSKFFKLMLDIFSEDYKNCPEFLRHKTFLASPQFLEKHGITCNRIVHKQGEYMITYPYGYHAGFNYGYNLAESVNFALDDWFDYAKMSRKCECIEDSVGINYEQIYCKFKGIPYTRAGYCVEKTMFPPKKSASIAAASASKNMRPIAISTATAKRQCVEAKKRKPETSRLECILCPNNLPTRLLSLKKFELLGTDQNDPRTGETFLVHRICAEVFWPQVEVTRTHADSTTETVTGIANIGRPHRSLKCLVCRLPNSIPTSKKKTATRGACFQCSAPRCVKSYHATCALLAGFLFTKNCCKTHRPSHSKYYEREDQQLHEKLSKIPRNSMIQYTFQGPGRRHTGEVHGGLVIKNLVAEHKFEVACYPGLAEQLEIHYDDVLFGCAEEIDNGEFIGMEDAASLLDLETSPEPPGLKFAPHPLGLAESNYSFGMHSSQIESGNSGKRDYVFVNEFPGDALTQTAPDYSLYQLVTDASWGVPYQEYGRQ